MRATNGWEKRILKLLGDEGAKNPRDLVDSLASKPDEQATVRSAIRDLLEARLLELTNEGRVDRAASAATP